MLPINFHHTFVPERRLLAALLHYAALGKSGSYQSIAEDTGIPMGKSTGKVPAILAYAQGMGLVDLAPRARVKTPTLTPWGRIVYTHDRYMGHELTQWFAHLNLCQEGGGAVAWRSVFCDGWHALGSRFTREQVEAHLTRTFGNARDRTGPMLRTYLDDAALGRAGVLTLTDNGEHVRRAAPLRTQDATAWGALLLEQLELQFGAVAQVTLTDFEQVTQWSRALGWREDMERCCELVSQEGWIRLDRQRRPWVLERNATAAQVWNALFEQGLNRGE